MFIKRVCTALTATLLAAPAFADDALRAALASPQRQPQYVARDAQRHPYETLTFFGLKPGQTIVEIQPGGGYWTEILGPYAKATGGTLITTQPDLEDPATPADKRKSRAEFEARYGDKAKYGKIDIAHWGPKSRPLGAAGSADLVISARNVHNWLWSQMLDKAFQDYYSVLKPGGILALEEHRSDPRPQRPNAGDGYMETAFVVAAAERAGFKLEAQSEINANPKDTKDHPFGVWTLPPDRFNSRGGRDPNASFDRTKYDAIGESDRMTLRFRKPR